MPRFPSELVHRTPVLVTDKLLVHNITTGATEYCTVEDLFTVKKLAGTLYWSCLGIDFTCSFPDRQYISYFGAGYILINEDDVQVIVGVSLPHGATIQSCIVLGNNAAKAETWLLRRVNISDLTAVTIGGNNINTIDNVLAYNVVDNNLYGYIIYTSTMDINDIIKGVKITYTL